MEDSGINGVWDMQEENGKSALDNLKTQFMIKNSNMKKTITAITALAIATSMSFAGLFDNNNIKIKGIYLGMSMEEALVACKQMVQETEAVSWANRMEITKAESDGSQAIVIRNGFGVPLLMAVSGPNQNGKLTMFVLDGIGTNMIFKCGHMGSQEFTKMFIDAYGIPEVKPDETGEHYEYQTDDGTKVLIGTDKSFVLQKVKTQEEAKSTFN
jgi:hypothetical protein